MPVSSIKISAGMGFIVPIGPTGPLGAMEPMGPMRPMSPFRPMGPRRPMGPGDPWDPRGPWDLVPNEVPIQHMKLKRFPWTPDSKTMPTRLLQYLHIFFFEMLELSGGFKNHS